MCPHSHGSHRREGQTSLLAGPLSTELIGILTLPFQSDTGASHTKPLCLSPICGTIFLSLCYGLYCVPDTSHVGGSDSSHGDHKGGGYIQNPSSLGLKDKLSHVKAVIITE